MNARYAPSRSPETFGAEFLDACVVQHQCTTIRGLAAEQAEKKRFQRQTGGMGILCKSERKRSRVIK